MGRSPLLDRGGITGQELRLALVGPRLDDAGVRSSRTVAVVRCSTDRCLVRSGLLPRDLRWRTCFDAGTQATRAVAVARRLREVRFFKCE
jgi:hypothetical protein